VTSWLRTVLRRRLLLMQDPYANSFKPRWRGLPDWPSEADRGTGKSGWVAERKCVSCNCI
jgi:meiotically up-regulated gene 157 (Mug157) protein